MVLTGGTVAGPRPAGGQVAAAAAAGVGAWQTMSVLSGVAALPKRRPTLTPFGDGGGETIPRDEHHRQPKRLRYSLARLRGCFLFV